MIWFKNKLIKFKKHYNKKNIFMNNKKLKVREYVKEGLEEIEIPLQCNKMI